MTLKVLSLFLSVKKSATSLLFPSSQKISNGLDRPNIISAMRSEKKAAFTLWVSAVFYIDQLHAGLTKLRLLSVGLQFDDD